jgi:four helix bundle protein
MNFDGMRDAGCVMRDTRSEMRDEGHVASRIQFLESRIPHPDMSYRNLEIWKLARQAAIDIHRMTLQDLPAFEKFEEGSQIRRSVNSVRSNIVEGYGRRRYKQEFIRFLIFAHASCDETIDHLEGLYDTGSLKSEETYRELSAQLDLLGRKLNVFISRAEQDHRIDRPDIPNRASRNPHPA